MCAVDAAYRGDSVAAVASVLDEGRVLEQSSYVGKCSLPYVSGLFYLREGPFVVEAVKGLKLKPQLLCFDAHGAAHPRSAGLATVCGMVLGIPSVGVAKSPLVGRVVPGREGVDRVVENGRTVGFSITVGGKARYWSGGYSVDLRKLESLVRGYAPLAHRALSESDRAARNLVRAT